MQNWFVESTHLSKVRINMEWVEIARQSVKGSLSITSLKF